MYQGNLYEDLESDAVLDLQFRAAGNLQNDQPVVLRKFEDGKVNAVVTTIAVRTGLPKLMMGRRSSERQLVHCTVVLPALKTSSP